MRCLVLGLAYPDSFTDNVCHALASMGHEARSKVFPFRGPGPGRAGRMWSEFLGRAGFEPISPIEKWALRVAQEWHPEVVIAPTVQVGDESLAEFKRLGVRARVAWWGDAPANMVRRGLASKEWDLILFKDKATVAKYRLLGLKAHLLHEAMNPSWHRPVASAGNEDICVVGNWYGYRQSLVQALLDRGQHVTAYGSKYPRWCLPDVKRIQTGRYVVKEEKSRVFGQSLACLNSFSVSEADSLNCRAFEIAGAGGLQLIEDRPAIGDCFDPGTEVLAFSSVDQIVEWVDRARQEPLWASKIRAAGALRARSHHTYQHRLSEMFSLAGLS